MATQKSIYKYQLGVVGSQLIKMPKDAEILSVKNQQENLVVYALVTPDEEIVERRILVYGTGHPIRADIFDDFDFVGTVNMNSATLVWHVFADRV